MIHVADYYPAYNGWTCPNAEVWTDSEHACVRMHRVLEGDGWWWALNGCTNQPEGWPLGPVVGQTALGAGMAGMDRQVQMQHDLAGDGGGRQKASKTVPGEAGEWWWVPHGWVSLPKDGAMGAV